MVISNRNYNKLIYLFHFCNLYKAHRDFDLAKKIAKLKPSTWQDAEVLSNFCNQIIVTKESKPQDFIVEQNESSNNAIDKYLLLKKCINDTKSSLGAKNKDKLYKSVKVLYRKKKFCYQMDSYYTWVITGFFMYINDFISFEQFKNYYCFEISLFTGEKKPINIKQIIKITQYILKC